MENKLLSGIGIATALMTASLVTGASGASAQVDGRTPIASVDANIGGQDRIDLTGLINDSRETLVSERFRANLLAFAAPDANGRDTSRLWLSKTLQYGTVTDLTAMLTGAKADHRYVFAHVQVIGNASYDQVFTGSDPLDWGRPLVQIGRVHLARYRSTNIVERSCAVNTLAHELTHTISGAPGIYAQVLRDTGQDAMPPGSEPGASYLVGSVAQCTYLQNRGRIGANDLRQCVAAFGQREFFNTRCASYADGVPVRWPLTS